MITAFSSGSTILVDKPLGWTSFDVVNKLRWHLKQKLSVKKIKVGHAGTLDPLATGLLVVCVGKNTKLIESLMIGEKTYTGKILLGQTTPSFDLETNTDQDFPVEHITEEMLEETRLTFLGEQEQMPPIYSAKQVDGRRAYDLARAGETVILNPNRVEISSFKINAANFPEIEFEVSCSKGTYIRSLAHDFGKKLSSGGTLIELRRTKSGDQTIEESKTVDQWIEFIQNSPL